MKRFVSKDRWDGLRGVAPQLFIVGWVTCTLTGCLHLCPKGPVTNDVLMARRMSQKGMDALDRGRIKEAEVHFADALSHCPNNVEARCRLAECLWQRGASYDAIEQLSEAVARSDRGETEVLVRLGRMHMNVGETEQAKRMADLALRSAPNDASAWQLKGAIQQREKRWLDALASYQRALSLEPQNVETQLAVAEIYQRTDRPARALATLNRIDTFQSLDEQPTRILALKGITLHQLERYDEAARLLAMAIEREGPNHALLTMLARSQYESGQYDRARATIRDALPLAGAADNESLKHLMAQMAVNRNNLDNR